jgi:hypothetical protein
MSSDKKILIIILIVGIFFVFGGIIAYNEADADAKTFEKEGTTVYATISNVECKDVAHKVVVTDSNGDAKKDLLGFDKTTTEYTTHCSYNYTYTYNGQSYTKSDSKEGTISNGTTFMVGINKNNPGQLMTIPGEQTKGGILFLIILGVIFAVCGGIGVVKKD